MNRLALWVFLVLCSLLFLLIPVQPNSSTSLLEQSIVDQRSVGNGLARTVVQLTQGDVEGAMKTLATPLPVNDTK